MRVYNELGRRDNLTKARIKILVRSVGVETFRDMVEAEFKSLKQAGIDRVRIEDLDRVRAQIFGTPIGAWQASDRLSSIKQRSIICTMAQTE
jgi:sulfite reductase (NADPH) hemoprotein beta-component